MTHPRGPLPEAAYARSAGGVYLAYQTLGDGPVDVAFEFNLSESNVDLMWEEPDWRPFLLGAAEFARVIVHDRRGVGASSRNVPPPNLETRVSDLLTVLDAAGSNRAILVAGRDGGSMHALFAGTHPDRVHGLVWVTPSAKTAWSPDYPWGMTREDFDAMLGRAATWGTSEGAQRLARLRVAEHRGVPLEDIGSDEVDQASLHELAKVVRNTATPDVAEQIVRIDYETDVRSILPSIQATTAIVVGDVDEVDEARYLASLMPNATVQVVPGASGISLEPAVMQTLRTMAGAPIAPSALDTVLSTVLFTDIVDSTARQAAIGDHAWKLLVLSHHALVRKSLQRYRGVENDTAGDGFYATFDGPARAIRCALEIADEVRTLGIEIRAGVHTGECEIADGKCAGLTVSIGARVASHAGPSEVLVSQTVKDLVAGSGLSFEERGEHELKGVPDRWRLYRVAGARN